MATGDILLSWVRRTRSGGEMRDAYDVPLPETSEAYEVDIYNGKVKVRTLTGIATNSVLYTVANQTTDFGSPQTYVRFQVFEIGRYGRGFGSIIDDIVSIRGLATWYKADGLPSVANGVSVPTWYDDGPLAINATQAIGSQQPTYQSNQINGLPALLFTRSASQYYTAPSLASYFRGEDISFTVWIVARTIAVAAAKIQSLFSMSGSVTGCRYEFSANGNTNWNVVKLDDLGNSITVGWTPVPDTSWHLHCWVVSGTNISYYQDGTLSSTQSQDVNRLTLDQFMLGARSFGPGDQNWDGYIAEEIFYLGAQSGYDFARAKYNLANKYNLTVT